jgi:hypothetical protein
MDEKRVALDCRAKKDSNCSLMITGNENDVLDIGEQHAIAKHGMKKEGLREQLRGYLKEEALSR